MTVSKIASLCTMVSEGQGSGQGSPRQPRRLPGHGGAGQWKELWEVVRRTGGRGGWVCVAPGGGWFDGGGTGWRGGVPGLGALPWVGISLIGFGRLNLDANADEIELGWAGGEGRILTVNGIEVRGYGTQGFPEACRRLGGRASGYCLELGVACRRCVVCRTGFLEAPSLSRCSW